MVELQPVLAAAAPVVEPAAEVAPVAVAVSPAEPVILDCDLQVRQRLRFLAWMRRVQAESRHEEPLETVSS